MTLAELSRQPRTAVRPGIWTLLSLLGCALSHAVQAAPKQYIIFNVSHGSQSDAFAAIRQAFKTPEGARVEVGVASIFSYLHQPRGQTAKDLERFLRRAQETDTPVVVQLDGENWWGARSDLWNWWDPSLPGFSPSNRANVEWTSWSSEDAVKIAWRNWGRQIRVLPPPNLMSPTYRAACRDEMRVLIPLVLEWWRALPADQQHLLVGIKLGWESSVGVNAWYYPGGNALLDRPASDDPTSGLKAEELPARGVAQLGYAAVRTAGIRTQGQITEADLAEVVRRHLEDSCRVAAELGVPRDRLFTHVAGWKEDELLYQSALNRFSCPGWSFYQHAAEPLKEIAVQRALQRTDAPYWAAVEWLYQGPRQSEPWRKALASTLAHPRCRYLCVYNWEGVRDAKEVLQAVQDITLPLPTP